jgi:hypothetical protein
VSKIFEPLTDSGVVAVDTIPDLPFLTLARKKRAQRELPSFGVSGRKRPPRSNDREIAGPVAIIPRGGFGVSAIRFGVFDGLDKNGDSGCGAAVFAFWIS